MPLVTTRELFKQAMEQHFAVGAFNVNNMEAVQAIAEAAQEERAPVIIQVSQGAIKYAGLAYAAGLVRIAAEQVDVPLVLHLDHGTDFAQNVMCLRAGFTSLMFDGSKKPFEENIATTKRIAEIAHIAGIPVEAELGCVLQASDNVTYEDVCAAMTDPKLAREFIERTGADSLAIACGSVHAMREAEAELDIQRIADVRAAVNIPLVLHGSSGVRADSIVAAIDAGICKINVATYLNQAFVQGLREMIGKLPDEPDYRKHLSRARELVKERVREKIRLFRSNGRISAGGGFASPTTMHRSADIGAPE